MNRFAKNSFLVLALMVFGAATAFAQTTWTGAVNSNWNDPNNWNPVGVPTPLIDVIFGNGASNPAIVPLGGASVRDIIIQNGGGLLVYHSSGPALDVWGNMTLINAGTFVMGTAVSGNTVTFCSSPPALVFHTNATITNGGKFFAGDGNISFLAGCTLAGSGQFSAGTSTVTTTTTQTVSGNFTFYNLEVTSGTLTLTGTVTVTNNLTVDSGTTLSSTGSLTVSGTITNNGTLTGNITAGPATKLTFGQQPSNTAAGSSITPAVTVRIEDVNGLLVTTDNTTAVTLAIGTNPGSGTLTGGGSVTAVNGIATFSGLSIDKTGTGYTLSATSNPVLTGRTSNTFNITVGAATQVRVETAANGSGTVVGAQSVARGSTVTGYAISRDGSNNFVANVAATWTLVSKTGGVVDGDLVASIDTKSAMFTGHVIGSAQMQAVSGFTGTSGVLTVTAGTATQVRVETAANGSGIVVAAQSVLNSGTVTGYAVTRDASNNFIANVAATWTLISKTGGVVDGDLVASIDTKSAVFTGHVIGSAQMQAVSGFTGTSGVLTVTAGTATQVRVETAANGSGTVVGAQSVVSGSTVTGYAITRDASNNFIANVAATWTLVSKTGGVVDGDLVASIDTKSAVFTGHLVGSAQMQAVSGFTGTSGVLTVTAGTTTKFKITGTLTQTAGASQTITITAQDVGGNTATSYTGDHTLVFLGANSSTSPVTAPTVTNKSGTPVDFLNATTVTFAGGEVTRSMTLYMVETAIIATTDQSISATGTDRLSVTVSPAVLNKFVLSLASPQTNGAAFTGSNTITAQDAYGNTATGFSASTNAVTIVADAPLVGTVSGLGLSANNVLNQGTDFSSGVANLTTLGMKYTGTAGSGSFTATSANPSTGTSGSVTINAGALNDFTVVPSTTSPTTDNTFTVTVTARDAQQNIKTDYTGANNVTWAFATGGSNSPAGNPAQKPANGNQTFTNGVSAGITGFKLTKAGESTTITATASTKSGTSAAVTATPGAVNDFTVVPSTTSPTTDNTFTVTVTARDAQQNIKTDYTGANNVTWAFATGGSNSPAGNPAQKPADGNQTFTGGVSAGITGFKLTKAGESTTITATASAKSGTTAAVTATPGAVNDFTVVPSTTSPTTDNTFTVTVTARDTQQNIKTDYTGANNVTWAFATGGSSSPAGNPAQKPADGNQTFTNGVSAGITGFKLTKAGESTTITATASAKSGTSAAITATAGALDHFTVVMTSPQTNGTAFTGVNTITAQDLSGNTITAFNASTNNVTITASPSNGTITGLGSGSTAVLNQAGDFSNGVASVTGALRFTGTAGTHTFKATSADAKTGTSGTVTINAAVLDNFLVEAAAGGNIPTQTARTAFSIKITARDGNNNTVTGFAGTVEISSTGTLSAGSGTTATFTAGVLTSRSVTITNTGNFTITATQTGGGPAGTSNSFVVNPAALDHFFLATVSTPQVAGTAFSITLSARDASNNTVTGFTGTVNLTTTAGTISPTTSGAFSNGQRTESVKVTQAGLDKTISVNDGAGHTGTSNIFVVNPGSATTLALTSGNNQSGAFSTSLANPFVVTVTDSVGNPIAGRSVAWVIATTPLSATGQILSATSTTTDANGQASSTLALGNKVGNYTVTATATGLSGSPVTFTASASTGTAATIVLTSGNSQSGLAGSTLTNPFVVTVSDVGGNPVSGASVIWAIATAPSNATGQTLSAANTTTDANGRASSTLTFGNRAGNYSVTATSGSLTPVTFTASATVGAATAIALTSGNNQSGTIGTNLTNPFVVTVTDGGGNPVSGVSVTWSIATTPSSATGQTLSAANTTTDANGLASSTLTLGNKAGSYTVTATTGSLTPVTFTASAAIGAATTIALTSGNNQSGTIGTNLTNPFVVTVTDGGGNPVSGVSVTWAIATTPSSATGQTLSATNTTTDANGRASSTLTLGNKVGSYTVTATSGTLSGSPITFTAVAINDGSNYAIRLDGTQFVTVPDNNTLDLTTNYTLEAWIRPRTFSSFAGLVSKFQSAGANGYFLRLTQTSPSTGIGFDGMETANGILTAGQWYHIAAVNENGTRKLYVDGAQVALSGTPITVQNNIDALRIGSDFNGRFFDGSIDEVRIWKAARTQTDIREKMHREASGTDSNLVSYWSFNEGAGTLAYDATLSQNTGTLNATWFLSTAPLAKTIASTSGNGQSGTVLTVLAQPFVVTVTNAQGNPVAGVNVTFAIGTVPSAAAGQSLSVTSAKTDTNGRASTILTLGNKAGAYTVTATTAGLTASPITFTATATGTTDVEQVSQVPTEYSLVQNFPNPFNPSTKIRFGIPEESRVKVQVVNMLGNVVAELVNDQLQAGLLEVIWNADALSSGTYFVRMDAQSLLSSKKFTTTRRAVLLK